MLECCQYTEDEFWERIFEELAYGKAPFGSYINKGFLCCGFRNKEFTYRLERKDPKILYEELYELLTNKLGLLSNKQKLEKRKRYREEETSEIPQDWSSIRRKNIKDIMYQNFVLDMKKKYSLDMKQTKMLLAMLTLALLIKSIGPKDIIYENERIQEIQGIEFEKGSFAFSRPIYSKIYTSNSVEGESEERIDICQEWDKYIGELQTRMI
jgi:hypothetical protein